MSCRDSVWLIDDFTKVWCLGPEVLLSFLFLFFSLASLFRRPLLPACSYLSQWRTLTGKRTWLLVQGKGGGGSKKLGGCIPVMLHPDRLNIAICSVSDKLAACLPPVYLAAFPMNLNNLKNRVIVFPKCFSEGGSAARMTHTNTCQLTHVKRGGEKRVRIVETPITYYDKSTTCRGRKKSRGVMGGS